MNILPLGRLRRFGAADRALLLLSVICGFLYLITQNFQPYPGGVLLKVLSVAPLAVIAFRARPESSAKPRGVGRLRDRDNVLFLISDSILAVSKFKSPMPAGGYLIWGTYYLAQYGIAIGFLREKLGENQ
jgi:uncharacterized membrane protein YhhN